MLAKVCGRKARFCGVACRDGFACDREHGAIYSAFKFPGGLVNPEPASVIGGFCCYCGADVANSRLPASHYAMSEKYDPAALYLARPRGEALAEGICQNTQTN